MSPRWRHLHDELVIVSFHDHHPENWLEVAFFFLDTKLAIKWARQLKITQNLFHVMRICSAVVLSYLDHDREPGCLHK